MVNRIAVYYGLMYLNEVFRWTLYLYQVVVFF